MKKKLLLVPLAFAFTALGLVNAPKGVVNRATGDFSNLPESGNVAADSYICNQWQTTVGARRISDKGVIAVDQAGWGYRAAIKDRSFDLNEFYFSIDLSNAPAREAMMIMVGNNIGTYCDDASNKIAIDIVKHSTDPTLFMVTVDTTSKSHANSIPEWLDGSTWQDDGAYKGRTITANDGVINFKMKKNNVNISTITCNDQTVQVSTNDLYNLCDDGTVGYVAIANYGGSGLVSYIVNEIGDASDETYFGNTGAFGIFKSTLNRLDSLEYGSINNVDLTQAKLDYDTLPYSDLYRYDKAYFSNQYISVGEKIDNAIKAAGNSIQIGIMDTKVNSLASITSNLTTEAKIDEAVALCNEIDAISSDISKLTLVSEEEIAYNGIKNTYATEKDKVLSAIKIAYENAVSAYELKVGSVVTSGVDYADSLKLKAAIPTRYVSWLSEPEFNAFQERIDAAAQIAESSTTLTHNNWKQGVGAKVITTRENTIDLVSSGNSMDLGSAEETSGLYLQESLNVLDFSVKFNVTQLPQTTGSWFTIGFMQHPDMWVYANRDVTENQGIYFLISKISSTQLQVETHLCSMSSADFYDSILTQKLTIPYQTDITLSFSTETRTVAGVSDTYFNIKFNSIALDQEAITARKIKTVIPVENGVQRGYFFVASSGYAANNPAVIQIKDINGFSPLADSVFKAKTEFHEPTSTSSKVTFVSGSANGKATFNVDMHGEEFVSLTVDGKALNASDYTVSDTKIVINNAACNKLSKGDHTVTLTTTGGSISWTLNVVGGEGDTPDEEKESSSGCGGSIIATSSVISLLSLLGICLIKGKKDN